MQKPTIEKIEMEDLGYVVNVVTDTNGVRHHYCGYGVARDFHAKELKKYEADQNPQILFESETVKVIKFKDVKQFLTWVVANLKHRYAGFVDGYDFNLPVLCVRANADWWVINNLTDQLIADLRKVVETV